MSFEYSDLYRNARKNAIISRQGAVILRTSTVLRRVILSYKTAATRLRKYLLWRASPGVRGRGGTRIDWTVRFRPVARIIIIRLYYDCYNIRRDTHVGALEFITPLWPGIGRRKNRQFTITVFGAADRYWPDRILTIRGRPSIINGPPRVIRRDWNCRKTAVCREISNFTGGVSARKRSQGN